jgi:hypothetical protein
MNAQAARRKAETSQDGLSGAVLMSLLFHACFVTVAIFGFPFLTKPPPEMSQPIPIEMADISELTQTNKPVEQSTPKPPDEKKAEPPKPAPERPKQAPKQTSATPPKPVSAPKDDLALPDKKAEKVKPEKPKIKPPEPPKKTLAKPEDKPNDDPFKTLLKNLQEEKPDPSKEAGKTDAKPEQAVAAPLGEKMTMSEMDALRQQLSQCWNVLAGARYAEDLVVDMTLTMNPDRTVQKASVVDTMRYNTDNIFRAAADSAIRAINDPQCSPLLLPPDKYQQWKEITVRFDPREIL